MIDIFAEYGIIGLMAMMFAGQMAWLQKVLTQKLLDQYQILIKLIDRFNKSDDSYDKWQDKIIENACITLKYILVCESALLQNRHLETMIFCSIYSVCKIDKCDIKFNDILQKFEVLPVSNKNMFHEIDM